MVILNYIRYNNIDKLLIDGIETEYPDTSIKGKILNYYEKLRHEAENWSSDLVKLSESDWVWLQRCFTEEEVLMTLRKCRR